MVGEIIVFLYLGEKICQQIDYKGLIFPQAARRVNLKSILNILKIKFRILMIFWKKKHHVMMKIIKFKKYKCFIKNLFQILIINVNYLLKKAL